VILVEAAPFGNLFLEGSVEEEEEVVDELSEGVGVAHF
jgi:hypothetical protein